MYREYQINSKINNLQFNYYFMLLSILGKKKLSGLPVAATEATNEANHTDIFTQVTLRNRL
jgi:hypothetical protein